MVSELQICCGAVNKFNKYNEMEKRDISMINRYISIVPGLEVQYCGKGNGDRLSVRQVPFLRDWGRTVMNST